MTGQSVEPRPGTLTSEQMAGKGTVKSSEPWQQKAELWKSRVVEKVIDEMSGMAGDTTEDFQKYYAQVFAESIAGLDVDEELAMMLEYARISGDKQGKNKVQIVQILEDKPAIFPGAGGLYPPEQQDPGILKRMLMKITGEKPA